MKRYILLGFATIGIIAAQCAAIAAPRFTVTDIGHLEDGPTGAYNINNSGQVVGYSAKGDNGQAFFWNGTMQEIPTINGSGSWAYDINDSGSVVGNNSGQAFIWNGVESRLLGTIDGRTGRWAYAINNNGTVVGTSVIGYRTTHAFIYENDTITDIGGVNSEARDINDNGQVVGWAMASDETSHAYMWQGTDSKDLGTLDDYTNSWARGINIHGQVVGDSNNGPFGPNDPIIGMAFLWQNDEMISLGTLGGSYSVASGISDNGQIVGTSTGIDGMYRAFLWDNNQILDLNNLISTDSGWMLEQAYSVNNNGQIVGFGTYNGISSAFLLTPVPEPSSIISLLMIGSGGFACALKKRSRKTN